MAFANLRFLFVPVIVGLLSMPLHAQTVQPGLEAAVKWKWSVLPSEEKDWGLPVAEPVPVPEAPPTTGPTTPAKKDLSAPAAPSIEPGNYEVKKGDALAIIARKSGIPVSRLKLFNELPNDTIRIGQILKIPTQAEAMALVPPAPVATPTPVPTATPVPKKSKKLPEKAPEEPVIDKVAEATLIQAFLDRENFSSGPIDGTDGPAFQSVSGLYLSVHPDLQAPDALRAKAVSVVGAPYTTYKLRASDFRFIAPPKPTLVSKPANAPVASRPKKPGVQTAVPVATPPPAPRPSVTYEELLAASYSAYRTPWEFVAEKFHCDEAFLRSLNPKIKTVPTADMELKVPNVTPFEIEKCFDGPLQPKANADKPITATIVELSRLEIRQGDQLIAAMPISRARPGLRGKGSWKILGAVAGPRLATRQESNAAPKPPADPGPGAAAAPLPPEPPPSAPTLAADQILAAGPRNPVGVYWIDLARADSTTPLPYGLHGTAIPSRTKTQESLGGFRLTNWDIARAVRLLPEGTPLIWK